MGDGGIAKGERLATGMVSTVSQNRETYNRAFQEKHGIKFVDI